MVHPANKGGGIVILDTEAYKAEMSHLLSDSDTYVSLTGNPMVRFKKELVEEGFRKKILSKKEKLFLVLVAPRVLVIYYLPKEHKDPVHLPGRSIISGIGSVTSRVGKYIDYFLQPLVVKTHSFLCDSMQVFNILRDIEWKDGYIFATVDVSSLYTIISHLYGREALSEFG